jgi:recombinational DNA repair ATPase RecF
MISEDDMIGLLRSTIFTLEVMLYNGADEESRSQCVLLMDELMGVLEEMGGTID